MIIGGLKGQVIENIQKALAEGDYNRKVEFGDPDLSPEEKRGVLLTYRKRYLSPEEKRGVLLSYRKRHEKKKYKIYSHIARSIRDIVGWQQNLHTKIIGMEYLRGLPAGVIVTSNHFSPLDNTIIRKLSKKAGKRRLYVVSQETNFAVKGFLGFLLRYADTIPISSDTDYMEKAFEPHIRKLLKKGAWILIYPEQEMWFHYKKPRPPKRGAYYYAAKCGVPIVSCFVEMRETKKRDSAEFRKVRWTLHILPPIFPEKGKTVRENSMSMMQKDYEQKKAAYEKIYGKKCTYLFEPEDIAGWLG